MSTPITERDIGRGIDQFHPENKIPEGFWLDHPNWDPTYSGTLKKRTGYEAYSGFVPLRCKSVVHSGTSIDFELDAPSGVSSSLRSGPVVIGGRLSAAQSGDLTSTAYQYKWYSSFTVVAGKIRVTDSAGVSTSYTDSAPEVCVWGIRADASTLLADPTLASRWGWVNHVDTFRSSLGVRAVAGMNGVLHASLAPSATHPAASLSARIRATVSDRASPTFATGAVDTTNDIITSVAHGLVTGAPVAFTSGGTVPAGLTAGTTYYAIRLTADTFAVAVTLVNAAAGTRLNITSVGTGTHTLHCLSGLGPAFVPASSISARTPGYVATASAGLSGYLPVASVAYVSTGLVTITLTATALTVTGASLAAVLSTNDWLTLEQMHLAALNGTFRVASVSQPDANSVAVVIRVADAVDSRMDITGGDGRGAILTCPVYTSAAAPFLTGTDGALVHTATALAESDALRAHSVTASATYVGPCSATSVAIPAADTLLYGRQSAAVLPLRLSSSASVTGLVAGDSLDYSVDGATLRRRPRVVTLSALADETVSVTAGVITLASSATYAVGDLVLLTGTTSYDGVRTLTAVPDGTHVTFASDATTTESGVVVGHTATLCAAEEAADDSTTPTTAAPNARWFPLEFPLSLGRTKVRHFDYYAAESQKFIHSVMAQDAMYFTDGVNPVMKYDGTNLLRAGLPRWQASLAAGRQSTLKYLIPGRGGEAISSVSGSRVLVARGAQAAFPAGSHVTTGDGSTLDRRFLVLGSADDGTNGQVTLSSAATADTSIYPSTIRKYYARLNMIDANNRVTASAPVGSQDLTVDFGADCTVYVKLLRLPFFEGLDYGRVSLELYGTSGYDGAPPYYKLASWNLSTTDGAHALTYYDTTPPSALQDASGRLDAVSSALKGAELGVAWDAPPRAKCMSYLSSRLVMGNLRGWPEWDFTLKAAAGNPSQQVTSLDLHKMKVSLQRGTASTTTNNSTVFTFEFLDAMTIATAGFPYSHSISNFWSDAAGEFTVDFGGTAVPAGVGAGSWVYMKAFASPALRRAAQMQYYGYYQVKAVTGTSLTVAYRGQQAKKTFVQANVSTAADTITITAHGFATGDVITFAAPNGAGTIATPLLTSRYYFAIRVDADTIKVADTYAAAVAGTAIDLTTTGTAATKYVTPGGDGNIRCTFATSPADIPVVTDTFAGQASGTYDYLFGSVNDYDRTAFTNESLSAATRLGHAVNAAMACMSQTGTFRPWLTAGAGNDFGPAEVYIRAPVATTDALTMTVTYAGTTNGNIAPFVNGTEVTTTATVTARELRFPSRLSFSYPNYPEVHDSPFAPSDLFSDSVVDVNPSDGQEITGVIPVFGESAFGAAQKDGPLLVLKEYSAYVVKPTVSVDATGSVVYSYEVQRLDTNGQGCTLPRTLAPTKNGNMFGNDSGMWKINRSLDCVPLGQELDRRWRRARNLDAASDVPVAHSDYYRNHWCVSVPEGDDDTPDDAYVYDYQRENANDRGAWTRYTNVPAIGWANVGIESVFATTTGCLFRRRHAGDLSDYRDDASAVGGADGAVATFRPVDLGITPFRKQLDSVSVEWRVEVAGAAPQVSVGTDFSETYEATDPATLALDEEDTALSDETQRPIQLARYTPATRRARVFTIRISDATIDNPVEVTGLSYVVDALTEKGVPAAAQTTR